jgi:hypothetical protein
MLAGQSSIQIDFLLVFLVRRALRSSGFTPQFLPNAIRSTEKRKLPQAKYPSCRE